MTSVTITDVWKKYGDFTALSNVSLEIADGEFVILVGPSGCGKSTLLRTVAGLEEHESGDIRIGENIVNDVPPKLRDIAMVFQNYALYPHMTVAQNMGFSLKLRRCKKSEISERVNTAAKMLGLLDLLKRYPRELSGGQRQRVAIGRAIVRNPKVFLFDEPLSNLDAKLRVQMRSELKELHRDIGATMIYVTHDQVEAMTMADKVVVMNNGKIEQVGAPFELYDFPANRFVAEFLGSPAMNLIECEPVVDATGTSVRCDDGYILQLPELQQDLPEHGITYGIRPEHLTLCEDGIASEVTLIEPLGSEVNVVVNTGFGKLTVKIHGRPQFKIGETVFLKPDENYIHIFDRKSGIRLS